MAGTFIPDMPTLFLATGCISRDSKGLGLGLRETKVRGVRGKRKL